jgi:hypothetical protein
MPIVLWCSIGSLQPTCQNPKLRLLDDSQQPQNQQDDQDREQSAAWIVAVIPREESEGRQAGNGKHDQCYTDQKDFATSRGFVCRTAGRA